MSFDSKQVPEKEGKSDFKRTLKDKSYERLMPCMNSSSLLKIKEHKETVEFTTVWFTWMLNEHEITCGWWCCIDLLFLHEITAENDSCRFLSHDDHHRHLCLFSWKEGNYIFNYDTSKSYVKWETWVEESQVYKRSIWKSGRQREIQVKLRHDLMKKMKWLSASEDNKRQTSLSLSVTQGWQLFLRRHWYSLMREMTKRNDLHEIIFFPKPVLCVFLCSTHSLVSVKESLMNILHIHP